MDREGVLLTAQRDPYLTELQTTVVSCEPADGGCAVVLDDTPFYPASGGQPSDAGSVGGRTVTALSRRGDGAVIHIIAEHIEPRMKVTARIDWRRRFDLMQQHTAQHLFTAIAQDRFGLKTTAFHLGELMSDVELDSPAIARPKLLEIEAAVNEVIRKNLVVTVREVEPSEMAALGVRSRGLPEGFNGLVRLVGVDGIDLNTCGGTHVRSTGEIQLFKVAQTEQMRGGTRVFYMAGGRVVAAMEASLERDRAVSRVLSCAPDQFATSAASILESSRLAAKDLRALQMELAEHLGQSIAPEGGVVHLHRGGGDLEFMKALADSAKRCTPGVTVFLTADAGTGAGLFLISGPPDRVKATGPEAARLMEGKGGGPPGVFQGKASRLSGRTEVLDLLKKA